MNNYFFGLGNGKVSDREAKRIQKAIDSTGRSAAFIRYDDPAEGPRYWFSAANRGVPFDGQLGSEVMAAVGNIKSK